MAERQLGGKPLRTTAHKETRHNMGGFEQQARFRQIGEPITLPKCEHGHAAKVAVGVIETRQVPKAKA